MKKLFLFTVSLFVSMVCFAQWQPVNNGISNLATGARLIGASNTHLFAVSFASGLYKSNDNGNNWTQITAALITNSSPPKCGYYFSGKYFVGLDNSTNSIYYTTDNGNTWTIPTGAPASTVVRGFNSLSGNLFAYTNSKGVFKSTDGGATWNTANTGLTNLKIASMTTINTKLIVATEGAGVYISSDNGVTWIQSNTGITGSLNGTFVWTMGTNLYYHTIVGNQYYSSNNEGSAWVAAIKPAFLQSTTFGQTKSIKEVYRNGSNLYVMSKTQYGLSITDSVFITTNEGTTWKNITENLPPDVLGAGLTELDGIIYIAYGSANLGIYRRSTTVRINEIYLSGLINIYPNPFNNQIVLTNQSSEKIVQISIYDIQGKLVLSENGNIDFINTSEFKSGLYVMEIMFSDNSTTHRKLIKESTSH